MKNIDSWWLQSFEVFEKIFNECTLIRYYPYSRNRIQSPTIVMTMDIGEYHSWLAGLDDSSNFFRIEYGDSHTIRGALITENLDKWQDFFQGILDYFRKKFTESIKISVGSIKIPVGIETRENLLMDPTNPYNLWDLSFDNKVIYSFIHPNGEMYHIEYYDNVWRLGRRLIYDGTASSFVSFNSDKDPDILNPQVFLDFFGKNLK